jgi:hypothetical protein
LTDWNPYPLTVNEETSLTRVYNLFRTVGLRHLCVGMDDNSVLLMPHIHTDDDDHALHMFPHV